MSPHTSKNTVIAKIQVIKIYKVANIDKTKEEEIITKSAWLYTPPAFKKGDFYLLYDSPMIGKCNFISAQIDEKALTQFEEKHPPIWVINQSF